MLTWAQLAVSSLDAKRSVRWYQHGLGMAWSGHRVIGGVPGVADAHGLPCLDGAVDWLLDAGGRQLEIWQFQKPKARPRNPNRGVSDIGLGLVGLHVDCLDDVHDRLSRAGDQYPRPHGPEGRRSLSVRDPDGIAVELREDRVLPFATAPAHSVPSTAPGARLQSVAVSVDDLSASRRFWCEGLGFAEAKDGPAYDVEGGATLGQKAATWATSAIDAGGILMHLRQHTEPRGRGRLRGACLADQGLSHVGLCASDPSEQEAIVARLAALGYPPCGPSLVFQGVRVTFVPDPDGTVVEVMWIDRRAMPAFGLAR